MSFKDEFRLKKIGFNAIRSERFCVFQWRSPGIVFLAYRIAAAAYTVAWLSITARDAAGGGEGDPQDDIDMPGWGAYLTNWTYVLLTLYFVLHAVIAATFYVLCRGSGLMLFERLAASQHRYLFHELGSAYNGYAPLPGGDEVTFSGSDRLPWYFCLLWTTFSAVSVGAVMVTLVFWIILVPDMGLHALGNIDNLQLHLVNTILILIEHSVTAVPVRIMHFVYAFIYGMIYMLFSVIYWWMDHDHVMYSILDWNRPWQTMGFILIIGLVLMPLIHLAMYGLYRLRTAIYKRVTAE